MLDRDWEALCRGPGGQGRGLVAWLNARPSQVGCPLHILWGRSGVVVRLSMVSLSHTALGGGVRLGFRYEAGVIVGAVGADALI